MRSFEHYAPKLKCRRKISTAYIVPNESTTWKPCTYINSLDMESTTMSDGTDNHVNSTADSNALRRQPICTTQAIHLQVCCTAVLIAAINILSIGCIVAQQTELLLIVSRDKAGHSMCRLLRVVIAAVRQKMTVNDSY
jgi:hypothetical protein